MQRYISEHKHQIFCKVSQSLFPFNLSLLKSFNVLSNVTPYETFLKDTAYYSEFHISLTRLYMRERERKALFVLLHY